MKQIIDQAIRNVKDFFVESIPDFGLEIQQQGSHSGGTLFEHGVLAPMASRHQPSNPEAVFHALARATELYFAENVAPLLRNVPGLRWQIKQVQLRETVENMHILAELNKLAPSILNTVSKAVICKLPCAQAIDMSQFDGFSIVPDAELAGHSVVMWANVGQDKTAMHFHFDDDIYESAEETSMTSASGQARVAGIGASFHLRLIDGTEKRDIAIAHFPAIVGSASSADIQVGRPYVSHQHLVLNWDPVLQCVYLVDRSKHGTYLKGGRRLADGERVNLLSEGYFTLTNQADAPRCEYWHGESQGQGTALLPTEIRATAQNIESCPANASTRPPAMPVQPRSAAGTHFAPASSTGKDLPGGARPTLLAPSVKAGPLAWLQVRNVHGQTKMVAVSRLPFCIGREFAGDGFSVGESYIKVSRTHLRLLEQRGTGFGVNNESLQRPGQINLTYGEKGAAGKQFIWVAQPENSNAGWCVLGSNRLDGESVEVRLVAANQPKGAGA